MVWSIIFDIKEKPVRIPLKAGLFIGVILVGVCFAASAYFPIYEYSPHSIRGGAEGGLEWDYATMWSFHPFESITYAIPSFFGFGGALFPEVFYAKSSGIEPLSRFRSRQHLHLRQGRCKAGVTTPRNSSSSPPPLAPRIPPESTLRDRVRRFLPQGWITERRYTGNADRRRRELKISQRHPLPSKRVLKLVGRRVALSTVCAKSEPAVKVRITVDKENAWPQFR